MPDNRKYSPKYHNGLKRILSVKFGWICWYCGLDLKYRERHLDHIVPKSKGGSYDLDNLALTCGHCNRAKLDHTLGDFLSYLKHIQTSSFQPKVCENNPHPMSSIYQDLSDSSSYDPIPG